MKIIFPSAFRYISFLCMSFSVICCAQTTKDILPSTYIAHYVATPLNIDGLSNEDSWTKVDWSNQFIDIEGLKKPTYNTKVKMLWDEQYFYIFAKIEEPHVWATLKQRDTIIFYNNDFEVFIDPDGDTHNYYEMELNAINTVWDLFVTKPYREDGQPVVNDYNMMGLKSAVKIYGTLNDPSDVDTGWDVEMAIPWKTFRKGYFEDNVPKDDFWRVNFSRVNWDHAIEDNRYSRKKDEDGEFMHEYNWVWSPTGVINMHEPEKWGYVYFSSKPPGEKESFEIPKDDFIKWKLYEIYRKQNKYYKENNTFLTDIDSLIKDKIIVENHEITPKLELHHTGWNLSVKSPFSDKILIIKEDGKFLIK